MAPYQLTPAQLEKQAARQAAKLAKAEGKIPNAPKLSPEELERRRFLKREWLNLRSPNTSTPGSSERKTKILTWNLLAQTLVRRELFPGSDCLKWGDRKPMISAELEYYSDVDILCFQECDRLNDFLPSLPSHSHVETKGHGKLHGLVVMYRSARYRVRASKTLYLDEEHIRPDSDNEVSSDEKEERRRRGGTRKTKNVGLLVALEDVQKEQQGIIVATTHLFWHPKFAYERVRQSLILLRNVLAFRKEQGCEEWPAVIAGDFNTQCDEATYQLLTNPQNPLPEEIQRDVVASRFVHRSIEPEGESIAAVSTTTSNTGTGSNTPALQPKEKDDDEGEGEGEGEGEEGGGDTDEKSVKGTRPARADDGILEMDELIQMARELLPDGGCKSAYSSAKWAEKEDQTYTGRKGFERTFGTSIPDGLNGHSEPAYTCYTPLFKLTLDYLLFLPSPSVHVTQLLKPGTAEELGRGLPMKGISASDHIAVGCEIAW